MLLFKANLKNYHTVFLTLSIFISRGYSKESVYEKANFLGTFFPSSQPQTKPNEMTTACPLSCTHFFSFVSRSSLILFSIFFTHRLQRRNCVAGRHLFFSCFLHMGKISLQVVSVTGAYSPACPQISVHLEMLRHLGR